MEAFWGAAGAAVLATLARAIEWVVRRRTTEMEQLFEEHRRLRSLLSSEVERLDQALASCREDNAILRAELRKQQTL